ncbi:FUSC family protein [Kitasatospora sp. NBC_01539]|uniref:FUSC family protein n=1 Tax=Kitasatospora sp. NBC_01539 TaxID=2903577 RepID=UPI0038602C83
MARTTPTRGRTGPGRWLRARDPELRTTWNAVRVTAASCGGFYLCRYGLHQPVAAIYAVFGPVSFGILARLGGGARQRAGTLLAALPAAYVLVTLGTLLAVTSWAAAVGMLAVGFTVAYASVGGPRLVGLANGLQLFYILPCFPPYDPGTLPHRLGGLTVGVVLLAAAELLLRPTGPPVDYRARLARAAEAVAGLADRTAAACTDGAPRPLPDTPPGLPPDPCPALLDELRFSRIPVMERPASASAVDRALGHGATALRYTHARLRQLGRAAAHEPCPAAAGPLRDAAAALRDAAAGLRPGGPVPDTRRIEHGITAFEQHRTTAGGSPTGAAPGALALDAAEGARFLVLATRVSRKVPLPPDATPPALRPGPFWYAYRSAPLLWWARLRANLTPRSVFLQNAVRTALALAAARLAAGALDLTHGFWVMLATLTLMRTSAADTRTTLRPALTGTALGAAVAAVLLVTAGQRPEVYAAVLPAVMLVAFTVGPLLGPAWAQGTFTVVVATVFGQLAPASWQLAEARVLDVVTGACVGVLAGACAWPRGGGGEVRRRTAELLTDCADALRETAAVLTTGTPATGALRRARRSAVLAEATYAQYRSERHDRVGEGPDWQAVLLAGQHAVRGAEPLLVRLGPGSVPRSVEGPAAAVAAAFEQRAAALRHRAGSRAAPTAAARPSAPEGLHAVDVEVWLDGLLDDLAAADEPVRAGRIVVGGANST